MRVRDLSKALPKTRLSALSSSLVLMAENFLLFFFIILITLFHCSIKDVTLPTCWHHKTCLFNYSYNITSSPRLS